MTNEKKKTIIFTIAIAILALVLIGVLVFMELRKSGIIGSSESNEIMAEFNKVFNQKERTVIFYGSSECSYCDLQTPILEVVAEDYDVDYYSVDSILLSVGQRKQIYEKLDIEGDTPTTIVVENGEVVATQVGFVDGGELIDFFKESELVPEDAVYSKEKSLTFIDYDKYKSLIRSDETHVIVIGQTTCPHCIAIKSALNSVVEDYDVVINYLNLTKLDATDSEKFFESLEDIGYDDPEFIESGSFGTPLTLIVEDGEVTNYFSGERTISQLVREFKKAGIIKE